MSRDFLHHVFGTTPDAKARPADAKHLEGERVVIHGLKGRPELNGQRGRALKWNPESCRLGVELDTEVVGTGTLSVRAENVRLPQAGDAAPRPEIATAAAVAVAAGAPSTSDPEPSPLTVPLGDEFSALRAALALAPSDSTDSTGSSAPRRATRAGCVAVQEGAVPPSDGGLGEVWRERPPPSSAGAAALISVLASHASDPTVVAQARDASLQP